MAKKLYLHVPSIDELWYRQQLLNDPDTMSYNRNYDLDIEGYHKDTGCLDFPKEDWQAWYQYFVCGEPMRFYAYIVRSEDEAFIGEVNLHKVQSHDWYEMGIVLEHKHRGNGYAEEALNLLLKHAFENLNADAVHNEFEDTRYAAVKTHLFAGFTQHRDKNGFSRFTITKEQYFSSLDK